MYQNLVAEKLSCVWGLSYFLSLELLFLPSPSLWFKTFCGLDSSDFDSSCLAPLQSVQQPPPENRLHQGPPQGWLKWLLSSPAAPLLSQALWGQS